MIKVPFIHLRFILFTLQPLKDGSNIPINPSLPPQLVRLDLCTIRPALSPRCISLPRHIWKRIDFGILFYEWELGGCKWWTGCFIVRAAKLLYNYICDCKARWLSTQLGRNTASEIKWCLVFFMSQTLAGTPEPPSVGSESLFPERPFVVWARTVSLWHDVSQAS